MNGLQVSVIVPVFNGEKHLRFCLNSLVAQQGVELEFILVDNGSTDGSRNILEEYSQKDNRIKIITLFPNQGVYGARNAALRQAGGEYIAFADCDDYVCPDAYNILYHTVTRYDSDVVIGGFQHVYDSGEVLAFHPKHTPCMFEPLMCGGAIWNKLFRRRLLVEHRVEFPPRNHMEDNVFLGRVYRCHPTIVIEERDVYHYMQRMRDAEGRLTASSYESVMQSFQSVEELYSEPLPCEDGEVFNCFFGALHYLRDLWCNMGVASEQKATFEEFRKTIATLPWQGREEYFFWCFQIPYEDYLAMNYAQFASALLRVRHGEVLSLNKRVNLRPADVMTETYAAGQAGLRDMARFWKAWVGFKKQTIAGRLAGKWKAMKQRVKKISPIFTWVIYRQYTHRGYRFYQKLREEYGHDTHLLLIPYEGTGDAYLVGCILEEYLLEHKIQKYIVLQPLTLGAKVLKIFGVDRVRPITLEERNWLSQFQLFCREAITHLHVMHFQPCNHISLLNRVEGIHQIHFRQMYEIMGFDFSRLRAPCCLTSMEEVAETFRVRQFKPGCTVVLAPYAETIPSMPLEIWQRIADRLTKLGYCVCTNSSGEREPVLLGTQRVFYPFGEILPAIELAGAFVGIRSGLCDVISGAHCKKVIVYPKQFCWGLSPVFQYFSLNRMGLCSDAVELEFTDETLDAVAEQVIRAVTAKRKEAEDGAYS